MNDSLLGRWVEISGKLEKETSKNPDDLRELDVAAFKLVPVVAPAPEAAPAPAAAAPAPAAAAPPAAAPAPASEAPPAAAPAAATAPASETTTPSEETSSTGSSWLLIGLGGWSSSQ